MAKIRVSHGWRGIGLMEALQKARPHDVIVISEGHYKVDPIFVNQLRIVGRGDPSRIILETQIEALGRVQMENLTLQASHFHNAVKVMNNQARLELTGVYLHGDLAGKYPVVYSNGGAVVMHECLASISSVESSGIVLESHGSLTATDTTLPDIRLTASYAELDHVRATHVQASDGAKVTARGHLYLSPPKGLRCLVLNDESVILVSTLFGSDANFEAYVNESYLQLDDVQLESGDPLPVYKKGASTVTASEDDVVIMDPDTNHATSSTPGGPKSVLWLPEHARNFQQAVLPQLNKGDTLLLDEGEYFLEDIGNVLLLDINIEGRGVAEETILNGTISHGANETLNVSNITICPVAGANAINILQDGSLTLTNVVVFTEPEETIPPIYADSGTLNMINSAVLSETDREYGLVQIGKSAHLAATNSLVGWTKILFGASAHLQDCAALTVWAEEGATVTSSGELQLYGNSFNHYSIGAVEGASIHLEQLHTDDEYLAFVAEDASLEIGSVAAPDDAEVQVHQSAAAEVDVTGEAVVVSVLEPSAAQPATASPGPQTAPAGEDDQDEHEPCASDVQQPDEPEVREDPLAELNALIGLPTVKQQIEAFTQLVEFNQRRQQRGLKTTEQTMHSLFLGNPGTGKTTVARLLGHALYNSGAIQRDIFLEVQRRDLVGETLGASANLTQNVLERARGGVLFIDEAYALYQEKNNEFAQEAVDTLITFLEDNRESTVLIFAGYPEQMQDFLTMNPGLKSRIPNRFDFEDYTEEEIAQIGYQSLLNSDYTVSKDLYYSVVAAKYRQSSDNSNGRWVRNLNEQLIKHMVRRVMDTDDDDAETIADEDLYALSGGDSEQKAENIELLLQELDQLVGLDPVKDWVQELIYEVKANKKLESVQSNMERPSYHMVFAGNPGTGKTTVAAIISRLFYNLGILENPTVKEVDRSNLVGSYIGHTEANTTKAIDESMGGVLFVDEAYQLHVPHSVNDFGKLAIETFMTRLENDRDKFVAIFAGYTNEMKEFLGANPGLRSRIPLTIEFPDYTPDEVAEIVCARLRKSWIFEEGAVRELAASEYANLPEHEQSNGRWARNYAQFIEKQHKKWLIDHDIEGEAALSIAPELIGSLHTQRSF